ncbi:NAD(P)-binding protein [Teratosphaeria nubilosa]|uniref:NAD(P)-binding protein n=1 Tax=Teratosphaeria nubilosa TaxID=161662 RepID=A0A6G1LH00_9PEZI|nr:NAD(P)-binding protein [Teratosphaeria nubilosa]
MPVYIAKTAFDEGLDKVPFVWPILKAIPWLLLLYLAKLFFSGASNKSERNMHGKVVLVTGGTSGIGEAVVRELATRGAQIVLLTQHSLGDPFVVDFIDDLRKETDNHLITAEQVDLANLHSIRTFATKWIDNAPPRRLDLVVLCANTLTTSTGKFDSTTEGVELNWQVNYLGNFHLLSILSPALRAQPPDRDVRVLFGTCSSYMGGDLLHITQHDPAAMKEKKSKSAKTAITTAQEPTKFSPANAYATSKLALTTFALAFQKHLSSYKRKDGFPNNARVLLVDPGLSRTPGTRRWLTSGTLLGLLVYLLLYPIVWLVLKSPQMGAQSFLYAAMEERFGRGEGGQLIKECQERRYMRSEVEDEQAQKKLWEYSEQMVQEAEKRGGEYRAKVKRDEQDRKEEEEAIKEAREYKEKVGKKDRQKNEASRRDKKAG